MLLHIQIFPGEHRRDVTAHLDVLLVDLVLHEELVYNRGRSVDGFEAR